jgi:hypothetical protein
MKILNITGPGKNIGHSALSPAFVPDTKALALLTKAKADGYAGVRVNWAFDSMFPSPDPAKMDVRRLMWLVDQCDSLGLFLWLVGGSGPYPNQPDWVALAGCKTWPGSLPPQRVQRSVIELTNWALRQIWQRVAGKSLNPRDVACFQGGNECADGGVSDPTRGTLANKAGTGLLIPEMAAWLQRMAFDVNPLTMMFVGPGMECEAATAAVEVRNLCQRSWMRRFDVLDVHCYNDLPKGVVSKFSSIMGTIALCEPVDGIPVWIGETDAPGLLSPHAETVGAYLK